MWLKYLGYGKNVRVWFFAMKITVVVYRSVFNDDLNGIRTNYAVE